MFRTTALTRRSLAIAVGQGILGGAVAAVTLGLMHSIQHAIWSSTDARWLIPLIILTGGAILAVLHHWAADEGLIEQVSDAADPVSLHRRRTAFMALRGVVAVGFGGAIGPEASLIAVMGEISALVTTRVARNEEEERLIGQTGTSASLGALYGAPTGSTLFEPDRKEKAASLANIIAGAVGFISFLLVHDLFSAPGLTLGLQHVDLSVRDVAASAVAALFGSLLALFYIAVRGPIGALAAKITRPWARIMAGTVVFAAMATAVPQIRFSGHEDVGGVLELVSAGAWWALLGIALLKMVATAINLNTGWLGGDFFPLVLAGSAVGVLACSFLDLPVEAAAVAGMAAAATVGMRKPTAVFIIVVLVSGGVAIPAAIMGTAVGLIFYAITPDPAPAH
ncbi:chloride channel protein [Kocuria rhizophila]|uniref:chloride channel protein n=1 Tax=Kocuria rhizophila TaxID=72000 RepID=UPI001EF74759|nr:chloride channel protein [Kocuria rhizophila]MCG7424360.1 chloride channel protein [Kocuria rhizophila]MCT1456116.1 chloride channel protein [Kocuria rhizophila]MCT1879206.1 chloride channel protein [Kocuria rhizophila]MCT2249013.1 chloride channel protein [Kocuria rhizophila]